MKSGLLFAVGTAYSVTFPVVLMRPIWLTPVSVNQSAPSGPAVIPVSPLETDGASVGDVVGDGVGLGVAVGLGLAVGVGVEEGRGVAEGVAVGEAIGDAVGDAVAAGVGDAEARGVGEAVAVGDVDAAGVGVGEPVAGTPGDEGTVFAVPPEPLQPAIAMSDARTAPAATDDRAMSVRWRTFTSISCAKGKQQHPKPERREAPWGDTLLFAAFRP